MSRNHWATDYDPRTDPINDPDEAGCQCESTRFDLDEFGRLYVPDLYRFRVTVLDGAGNEVAHFGGYGNRDAKGEGTDIPLAMGLAVAATDRHIYVGDIVNQHVVRVRLTYAAESTCGVE